MTTESNHYIECKSQAKIKSLQDEIADILENEFKCYEPASLRKIVFDFFKDTPPYSSMKDSDLIDHLKTAIIKEQVRLRLVEIMR